jgi:integrase
MDPHTLLDDWLTEGTLRPSSQVEYRREVTRWLTWCAAQNPPVNPYDCGIEHVAAWCGTFLTAQLDGRPFDHPDALAHIAQHHRDAALTHDRRVTAINQFNRAAKDRGIIRLTPDLTMLRSGLDRAPGNPRRLSPEERSALLFCIGQWGPDNARHYLRDRVVAFLLLEGLRPAEVTRVDIRHLYPLDNGGYEVRAPDYAYEAVGEKHVLNRVTANAVNAYLPHRVKPADGVHALVLGQGGNPITSEYPNKLIGSICSADPMLAHVTADAIAHTGFWDVPAAG